MLLAFASPFENPLRDAKCLVKHGVLQGFTFIMHKMLLVIFKITDHIDIIC